MESLTQKPNGRGLELMARYENWVYHMRHAESPAALDEAIAGLRSWLGSLTDADWDAMAREEYSAAARLGKAGVHALVELYANDPSPVGRR